MSTTDLQRTRIVLLKGASNYDEWKSITETILIKQGLWDIIEPEGQEDGNTTKRTKTDKIKAWAEINALLEHHIRNLVPKEKDPKMLWDKLAKLYLKKNNHTVFTAVQHLKNAHHSSFKNVSDYASHMRQWYNRVIEMGYSMSDAILAHMFISGLPESLDSYWTQLTIAADQNGTDITFEGVVEGVIAYQRRQENETATAKAMKAGNFGKQPKGKGRRNDSASPNPSNRQGSRTNERECSHCKSRKHTKEKCWYLQKDLRPEWWKAPNPKLLLKKE